MATLTIADLDNGKRDLQTIDEVANSRAASATTRFGQQTTTLYESIRRINATGDEILSNLGFRVPVDYAPGLNVTDSRFTVTGPDGKVYAPLSAPFTTGAWNPAQWYVLQNDMNDHKLLIFETLLEAGAAAATLPDGQVVDVESEKKRYVVQAGVLVFGRLLDDASVTSYTPSGTGAVLTTVRAKLSEMVSVKDFGAVGDSNGTTGNGTDNAAAFQAAIDYVKATSGPYTLIVPAGVYRLGSVLTVDTPLRIVGEGCAPYVGALGTTGGGSWLYFDHSGKGINIDGPSIMSGVAMEKFGTLRNQPTPSTGWTPNSHDYDIYIDNAGVLIDDLTLLNPTKGVFLANGQAGRLEIGTLRGQAFQTMLRVDTSYDVVKINNLHQWPFWQDDTRVHAYTLQNLDVLYFERTDNPMLANIFTIFARSGLRFGQNANGKTAKVHLVNADFDRGKFGVWVDNTVTTGVTGQFANVTYQWETGLSGAKGIFVEGNFSELDFVNTRSDGSADSAIHIAGSGNKINLSGRTTAKFYDGSATNVAAIYAGSGNVIDINGYPIIESGGGAGGRYGGNGEIRVDEWRAYSLTVTSTGGLIAALGAVSGLFKRYGNTVDIQLDIAITTNGTGSGALRATIPTQSAAQAVGIGRDVNVGGAALTGTISFGTAYVDIRKYDNSYPASDGSRLVVNASYRVA